MPQEFPIGYGAYAGYASNPSSVAGNYTAAPSAPTPAYTPYTPAPQYSPYIPPYSPYVPSAPASAPANAAPSPGRTLTISTIGGSNYLSSSVPESPAIPGVTYTSSTPPVETPILPQETINLIARQPILLPQYGINSAEYSQAYQYAAGHPLEAGLATLGGPLGARYLGSLIAPGGGMGYAPNEIAAITLAQASRLRTEQGPASIATQYGRTLSSPESLAQPVALGLLGGEALGLGAGFIGGAAGGVPIVAKTAAFAQANPMITQGAVGGALGAYEGFSNRGSLVSASRAGLVGASGGIVGGVPGIVGATSGISAYYSKTASLAAGEPEGTANVKFVQNFGTNALMGGAGVLGFESGFVRGSEAGSVVKNAFTVPRVKFFMGDPLNIELGQVGSNVIAPKVVPYQPPVFPTGPFSAASQAYQVARQPLPVGFESYQGKPVTANPPLGLSGKSQPLDLSGPGQAFPAPKAPKPMPQVGPITEDYFKPGFTPLTASKSVPLFKPPNAPESRVLAPADIQKTPFSKTFAPSKPLVEAKPSDFSLAPITPTESTTTPRNPLGRPEPIPSPYERGYAVVTEPPFGKSDLSTLTRPRGFSTGPKPDYSFGRLPDVPTIGKITPKGLEVTGTTVGPKPIQTQRIGVDFSPFQGVKPISGPSFKTDVGPAFKPLDVTPIQTQGQRTDTRLEERVGGAVLPGLTTATTTATLQSFATPGGTPFKPVDSIFTPQKPPTPALGGGAMPNPPLGGGSVNIFRGLRSGTKEKRYVPSLLGIFSGKRVSKAQSVFTGFEIRYPIGRRKK